MRQKIFILATIFTLFAFLTACSSSNSPSDSSDDSITVETSSSANVPVLPDDLPLYPGSVAKSGYKAGALTTITYTIADDYTLVQQFYNTHMPAVWNVDKEWFKMGESYQKFYKTSGFNQNPSARAGRQVVLTAGKNKQGTTTLVVMLTDYT